ncbi:pentatricopeptide repeat-containing protein At5g46460, mitochondrial-like [Dendrobium catenatum]|uniref:pentatricopeptide repeat-containing protein At5g46460, mitochondrial-like n=1 Tax=Dendrobium catenatum TaxID=906689 RepID=UPI0009F16CEE|nr:pentatricopeptide repeat-containing protein At5g46460, mitochondrial-like [Dendrobium catenatum]
MVAFIGHLHGLELYLPSVLRYCGKASGLEETRQIHAQVLKTYFKNDPFISNSILRMYLDLGEVEVARRVFNTMPKRNVISWNSMIFGCIKAGEGKWIHAFVCRNKLRFRESCISLHRDVLEVRSYWHCFSYLSKHFLQEESWRLEFYDRMKVNPDELINEKFKIKPNIKHYGCLIDLLGRAGRLENAHRIIDEMPMEPDSMDSSCYFLLSNLYAKAGKWGNVDAIRAVMKARVVRKNPGCSSVMINGIIHEFLVGKEMGVKCSEVIQAKLEEVTSKLKMEGYRPDWSQVLLDVEEEEKESLLGVHSEKLAIAFGLVNLDKGASIHIVKPQSVW